MSRKVRNRNSRMTVSAKVRLKSDRNRWVTQRNAPTSLTIVSKELFLPEDPGDAPFLQESTQEVPGTMLNVLSSYKDSTSTPNYRDIIKSGGDLPTTNLLHNSESRDPATVAISDFVTRPDGSWASKEVRGTVPDGFLLLGTQYVTDIKSEAEIMCNSKLVDKIANQAFSTGVFLGELGETVGTVTRSAQGLYRSYLSLRRGDIRTAASVLTDLSGGRFDFRKTDGYRHYVGHRFLMPSNMGPEQNSVALRMVEDLWLSWRYGYRLIIKDVEEAITSYEKLVTDPENDRIMGRPKDNLRVVRVERRNRHRTLSQQTSIGGLTLNGILSESVELSVTCGANYKISSPSVRTANQLGLLNVAEIAWNLTPWSFVFDWFVPVGKFLQQQGFESGLTFVRGWKTVRIKHSISGSTSSPPPGATWGGTVEYPENLGRSFHRTSYTPAAASLVASNGIPDSTGKALARALDAMSLLHGVKRSFESVPRGRKPGGFDYFDT